MHKFKKLAFSTLLITLLSVGAFGAPAKKPTVTIKTDTTKVSVRKFNDAALKIYEKDKDFNYNGQAIGQPSLWELFWNWLWSELSGLFRSIPYSGSFMKYLLLGLSIGILIFVIIKSLGIDPILVLTGKTKKIDIPYSESIENIHAINFDIEIEKAIAQHNYRLAVRMLYLRSLKQLSNSQLIKWEIDKTNSAYIYELSDPGLKNIFGILTRQFEYVWYGNFVIDQQAFGNIHQLFQNFKNQLL